MRAGTSERERSEPAGVRPGQEPFPLQTRSRTWLNIVDGRLRHRLPKPVYLAMLRSYHGARAVTGQNPGRRRVLPDFVIIGAAKAGTTSVYAWLCEQPFVRRPRRKEIDYFTLYHYRGPDWYRHHFPSAGERDAFATEHGRPFITGEASPSYLLDGRAPARMARLMPDAKLIVALRNPVDRAYSQFQMRRRTGHEPLESFSDALELEDPRFATAGGKARAGGPVRRSEPDWRTYLRRGRYAEQLERWFRHFPQEQFHFVELNQLAADQLGVLGELHSFLGIPPAGPEQLEARFTAEYDPMPAEVRARLLEYFRPHNQRLYEVLGREFAWEA